MSPHCSPTLIWRESTPASKVRPLAAVFLLQLPSSEPRGCRPEKQSRGSPVLSASPFWVPRPLLNGKIVLLPVCFPSPHMSLPASARAGQLGLQSNAPPPLPASVLLLKPSAGPLGIAAVFPSLLPLPSCS